MHTSSRPDHTWQISGVWGTKVHTQPGLHLEIDPKGGKMSIYEKEGRRSPVYMCISICTLGGSGGMLPKEILVFRLSETASGAFSGTL